MKFLHVADLHLGKRVCEFPMTDDQRYIMQEMVETAKREQVDGVLMAGDIYDRPVPPVDATELLSDTLTALHEAGIPVFLIAGNHDSTERLSFCAGLLKQSGVYVAGECLQKPETVVLEKDGLRVALHMLSFSRPAAVAHAKQDENIKSAESAMRAQLREVDFSVAERHILMAHTFVSGSTTRDSELPVIGTVDAVPSDVFKGFDYVALGHLHGPQALAPHVRYAGSPLPYSFSEVKDKKGMLLVEVKREGVSVKTLPLSPLHAMREVRGGMDELMEMPYSEDYIRAVVTDEVVAPDSRVTLRTVFPNLMRFAVENSVTASDELVSPVESAANRDPISLFGEFFELQMGREPNETELKIMKEVLEEAEVEA